MTNIDSMNTEEQDEYATDKAAYMVGKSDYTREYTKVELGDGHVVEVMSPFPKDSRSHEMWEMGYNYMHAFENM